VGEEGKKAEGPRLHVQAVQADVHAVLLLEHHDDLRQSNRRKHLSYGSAHLPTAVTCVAALCGTK
jgi:hypothetical protein